MTGASPAARKTLPADPATGGWAAYRVRHVRNPAADPRRPYGPAEREALSLEGFRMARDEIASWPGYAETPLVELPGLARGAGVASLRYKDEGGRFGLGSFKALGGAYAVLRILQKHLAQAHGIEGATAADLIAGAHRGHVAGVTVCCATDGNHGRSVAWGAKMFGCACRIYIHENVSPERERAIAAYGAVMVRLPGDYDRSVRVCAEDAARNGWALVADTNAGGGDPDVPRTVMQGYTVMTDEVLRQAASRPAPTHIFVPGGVGGLAAAVAGHVREALGEARPRIVAVEPHAADCIYRSIMAGRPTRAEGSIESFMACLAAGEVSPVAWPVLLGGVDDAVTIPDEAAVEAMRALARPAAGDPPVVSGESGSAGVAALLAASAQPEVRAALGLDGRAHVIAIGSEGATDPKVFEAVVGLRPTEVGRSLR